MIPGGGIGDGPIDGVVNLYVIDDATRQPLANATVRVGTLDGMTDATGLFVAEGLVGPQNVIAKMADHRSEMWIGANGANMTMALKAAVEPTPARANIVATIAGFDQIDVGTHRKAAILSYSNDDKASDAANNINTPNNANICDAAPGEPCNFAVVTRTGKVALLAIVYDHDTKGTVMTTDDTFTPITWAYKTDLDVVGGVNQTGVSLSLVAPSDLQSVIVDFGTPPSLPTVAAVVGIETASSGTMQLSTLATPAGPTVRAPRLSAITGPATYRLTAIATQGNMPTDAASFVLHRAQTATSLSADPWLALPTTVTLTRTTAAWSAVSGAAAQGVEYDVPGTPGTSKPTHLLTITSFDGSTSVTIPDLVALPTTGTLIGRATALQGTVDLTNFSADDLATKITGFSAQPMQID